MDLTNIEMSLSATTETKNVLYNEKCALDQQNRALRDSLNEQTGARKMADQKAESLGVAVDDFRAAKVTTDLGVF